MQSIVSASTLNDRSTLPKISKKLKEDIVTKVVRQKIKAMYDELDVHRPILLEGVSHCTNAVGRLEETVWVPFIEVVQGLLRQGFTEDELLREYLFPPNIHFYYSKDSILSTIRTILAVAGEAIKASYTDNHDAACLYLIDRVKQIPGSYFLFDEIDRIRFGSKTENTYHVHEKINHVVKRIKNRFIFLKVNDLRRVFLDKSQTFNRLTFRYAKNVTALCFKSAEFEGARELVARQEAAAYGLEHLLLKKIKQHRPEIELEKASGKVYLVSRWLTEGDPIPIGNLKRWNLLKRATDPSAIEERGELERSLRAEMHPELVQDHLVLDILLSAFDNHADQYRIWNKKIVNYDYARFSPSERYLYRQDKIFLMFRSVFFDHPAAMQSLHHAGFERLKALSASQYWKRRSGKPDSPLYCLKAMSEVLRKTSFLFKYLERERENQYIAKLNKMKAAPTSLGDCKNELIGIAEEFGNRYLKKQAKHLSDQQIKEIVFATVWFKFFEEAFWVPYKRGEIVEDPDPILQLISVGMTFSHPTALMRQMYEAERIGRWARSWKKKLNPSPKDLFFFLMPELESLMRDFEEVIPLPGSQLLIDKASDNELYLRSLQDAMALFDKPIALAERGKHRAFFRQIKKTKAATLEGLRMIII